MVNQTAFVDVMVVGTTTTTMISTISMSSTTTLTTTSEIVSEEEQSPDSPVPTSHSFMFSTSMAPPRPTPPGQEEKLITTVAPTIKDEHEDTDDVTAEELDDNLVIKISTIQPDVPIPNAAVSTESMFLEGKTETIMDAVMLTGVTSDLTAVESTEFTSKEVFSSPEPTPSVAGLHSTTPFPDYSETIDDIQTDIHVEGMPPTQSAQQEISSSPSDITDGITVGTTISAHTLTDTTQSGRVVEITTAGPPVTTKTTPQTQDLETAAVTTSAATPSSIPIDSETSDEDMTSTIVFEESTAQVPDHTSDILIEEDTTKEIGREFLTSPQWASSAVDVTTVMHTSGKTYLIFNDFNVAPVN